MKKVLIIGHRGASGLVEFENTLEAFKKAISLGISMIEFDVRKTKDNFLVCYHDAYIDGIQLAEINYHQLLEICNIKGFHIPLVEDVIKLCKGKIRLDIELKESGYEEKLVNLVKRYLDYSDYIMKSFNDISIKAIKEIDKNIITGLLVGKHDTKKFINYLSELFPEYRLLQAKADFVSPNYQLLTFGFCWRMKLIKKNIYVWTVNEEKLMINLVKKCIYALITDKPDLALSLFNR